jgi:hypothetical protein
VVYEERAKIMETLRQDEQVVYEERAKIMETLRQDEQEFM